MKDTPSDDNLDESVFVGLVVGSALSCPLFVLAGLLGRMTNFELQKFVTGLLVFTLIGTIFISFFALLPALFFGAPAVHLLNEWRITRREGMLILGAGGLLVGGAIAGAFSPGQGYFYGAIPGACIGLGMGWFRRPRSSSIKVSSPRA